MSYTSPAPLDGHIGEVVSRGAQEKMLGVHADPVVALVANKHPVWDGAAMEFIANTVRAFIASSAPTNAKGAVAVSVSACRPLPTLRFGVDFELG